MAAPKVTAESLFTEIFLPLYPPDAKNDLARARSEDANPAKNPTILAHLDEAAEGFVQNAKALFGEGAPTLDYTDASIHHLSTKLTPEVRDAWRGMGERGGPSNALFNAVVHGAAYVGACIVRSHAGAWKVRRPLWESLVHLKSRAGEADLNVFSWWLRSLSDDATETLADRYRALVEVPCATPETLPILAPPDRALPRIGKNVRYDVFYKYLKAHLPELRDVGADFPSPERFAELGFSWLDFLWLGEGRMLLLYGRGENGLHLFWMTAAGFEKAAFFPCDSFPEPIVRKVGDEKIAVIVSVSGKVETREMLWWGP